MQLKTALFLLASGSLCQAAAKTTPNYLDENNACKIPCQTNNALCSVFAGISEGFAGLDTIRDMLEDLGPSKFEFKVEPSVNQFPSASDLIHLYQNVTTLYQALTNEHFIDAWENTAFFSDSPECKPFRVESSILRQYLEV